MPLVPQNDKHNHLGEFNFHQDDSRAMLSHVYHHLPMLKTICNFLTKDGDVKDMEQYYVKYIVPLVSNIESETRRFFKEDNDLCFRLNTNQYLVVGSDIIFSKNDTKFITQLKREKIWIDKQINFANAMRITFTPEMSDYVDLVYDKLNNSKYTVVALHRPLKVFNGKTY